MEAFGETPGVENNTFGIPSQGVHGSMLVNAKLEVAQRESRPGYGRDLVPHADEERILVRIEQYSLLLVGRLQYACARGVGLQ